MALLQNEGSIDDDDDGLVIFVNSYFLDHSNHRHHDRPRPLRFDADVTEWTRDICLVWEDFADTSIPIDVTIVRPEPPSFPLRGTIATVIVHQRATPDTAAALITTVHIADPVTHFAECAHSCTRFADSDSDTILQAARADQLCRERLQRGFGPCTIHSGTAQLLDGQWHQLQSWHWTTYSNSSCPR